MIGERSYAEKVQSVFAAFPVFATFDACVEVIDVDAVPPPNHELGDNNGSIFCTPLPPAPGVPRYVRVTVDETELAPAANDDEDDISGEKAIDNFIGPTCCSLAMTLLLSTQMVTTTLTKSWQLITRFTGT